jgi:hypothetical protein
MCVIRSGIWRSKFLWRLKKIVAFLLVFAIVFPPLLLVPAHKAEAITTGVRHEINIINAYLGAASGAYATSSAIVQLDTTKYVSPTYYFETVASTSASINTQIFLRDTNGNTWATTSIPIGTTSYTRIRSSAFTIPAGQRNLVVTVASTTGATKGLQAARIIVLDQPSSITSSQGQFEIGAEITATSSATTSWVLGSKYWKYNSANWSGGTPTFYAEVTYQIASQVSSTTTYTVPGTYTYLVTRGTSYTVVELWGAGGGGRCSTSNAGGGGGGGGAYARSTTTHSVLSHTVVVAATTTCNTTTSNDSTYDTTTVVADGGAGSGASATGATGGSLANSTGQVEFAGGNGGTALGTNDTGGGGGGSAGKNGTGGNGSDGPSGATTSGGGGGGGNGGSSAVNTATGGSSTNGGAGGNGGASANGSIGTSNVEGGGGGGGSGSTALQGGPGGSPGGGGGGGDTTQTGTNGNGGRGQARLTEVMGQVGIAIEEDNGSFGSWTFKAQIVTQGSSTSTPSRVRSSAFTPTAGRHYRLVASTTHATVPFSLFNGKIIVDQSGSISNLEEQYLLANSSFGGTTGLKDFDTYYDPNEWGGNTITYYLEGNGVSSGTGDIKLQQDPNGSPADITGSAITDTVEVEQSSNMTMPVSAQTLDVNVTGTGTLYASRIISVYTANASDLLSIASETNQRFTIGQATTTAAKIRIGEGGSPQITTTNNIRIEIDNSSGFNFQFDNSVTTPSFSGSASGKVNSTVSYPSANVLLVTVSSNFSAYDSLGISGLKFGNFTGPTISQVGAFHLHTDGDVAGAPAATSTDFVTIGLGKVVRMGKPPNYLSLGNGLVGYWTLDGKDVNWATGAVTDRSGTGNTGYVADMSTTTAPVTGKIGQAFTFDGSDDRVRVPNASNINDLLNLSVSFWARLNGYGADGLGEIINKSDLNGANGQGWKVISYSTNQAMRFFGGFNGTSAMIANARTGSLDLNEWHHWVITWTQSTDPSSVIFYKDGVVVPHGSDTTGNGSYPTDSGLALGLGGNANQGTTYRTASGIVDDYRLYNRILSQDEVINLYQVGKAKMGKIGASSNSYLSSGLLGHWTFDGTDVNWSTGRANDELGTNNAIIRNMSTSTTPIPGEVGQAFYFDGTDDFLLISDSHFSQPNDWTLSAWVKPENYSGGDAGNKSIFLNGDDLDGGGNSGFNLIMLITTGVPRVDAVVGANSTETLSGTSALERNVWTHLAAVKNGTSFSLYRNGSLENSTTLTSATMDYTSDAPDTSIGTRSDRGLAFFPGGIDDVRVYSRAFSASEIASLFKAGTMRSRR